MDITQLLKAYVNKEKLNIDLNESDVRLLTEQSLQTLIYPVTSDSKYKKYYISWVLKQESFYNLQEEITNIFNDNNINHVYFKGSVLSKIYDDPSVRTRGDIDLYVDSKDFDKAKSLLLSNGYKLDTDNIDCMHHESVTKNGIEIEASPKIIDDKNCYSVTEDDLKVIEEKMGYRGVEQLLKPKRKNAPVSRKANFPNMKIINQVVENITSFQKANKEEETTPVVPNIVEEPKQESILAYKNQKTHQLFVPVEEVPETNQLPVQVMNKSCYETSIPELEAITNKKIIVAEYYPAAKEDLDVIICNHKGHLFISKSVLEQLGFYIEDPHRIMISGDIYEEITDDDIDLIKEKDSDTFHINIIMKQIAPKRG